jgi:hypothetical protein
MFLRPPVWRDPSTTPWGTVYTAAYDSEWGTLDLLWPDDAWRLSVHGAVAGERRRTSWVALAPAAEPAGWDPWAMPLPVGW